MFWDDNFTMISEVNTKNKTKPKNVQLVLTPLIYKKLFVFSLDVVYLLLVETMRFNNFKKTVLKSTWKKSSVEKNYWPLFR